MIPETLLAAIKRLECIYPEPAIVACPHCGTPWGIRLEKRGKDDPLSAISCGNRDCGKMFFS